MHHTEKKIPQKNFPEKPRENVSPDLAVALDGRDQHQFISHSALHEIYRSQFFPPNTAGLGKNEG